MSDESDEHDGLTGRDGYMHPLALAVAIVALESVEPEKYRALSDIRDIKTLLLGCFDDPESIHQYMDKARNLLHPRVLPLPGA